MKLEPIAIIGAGPAGIAAAIQLKRYGLQPLLFEKNLTGGLLWNANLVENYPGFPQGIPGPQLIALFEAHLRQLGIEVIHAEVIRLDLDGDDWIVETPQRLYRPGFVIVASGTKPRPLPIDIPSDVGDRIFGEVVPLLEVHHRRVVIVGAGDAAFDHALNLAKKRNFVTILNRGDRVKCLPLLWERATHDTHIAYQQETAVTRVQLAESGDQLQIECLSPAGREQLQADFLIFAIGRQPQLDFLSPRLRQQQAQLVANGRLYFVGDVKNDRFRQTAIAVGDGVRAAMDITKEF